jgi:hypothetical protein
LDRSIKERLGSFEIAEKDLVLDGDLPKQNRAAGSDESKDERRNCRQ